MKTDIGGNMKFSDLEFKQHPTIPGEESIHAVHFFPNGYGVSVVRFPGSYGYEDGTYEVAVIKGTQENWDLCYDTELTDDIFGHCDETDVENILHDVSEIND